MLGCDVIPAMVRSYSIIPEYVRLPTEALHFFDYRRRMGFYFCKEALNVLSEYGQRASPMNLDARVTD